MAAIDLYRRDDRLIPTEDIWQSERKSLSHFAEVKSNDLQISSHATAIYEEQLSMPRQFTHRRNRVVTENKSSQVSTKVENSSQHLLVLAIGLLASGILLSVFLITGMIKLGSYPLSVIVSTMVLIGVGLASASEWWSRVHKE